MTSFLQLAGITAGLLALGLRRRPEGVAARCGLRRHGGGLRPHRAVGRLRRRPARDDRPARRRRPRSCRGRRRRARSPVWPTPASSSPAPAARGRPGISMVLVPLDRPGVTRQVYDSVGGKLSPAGLAVLRRRAGPGRQPARRRGRRVRRRHEGFRLQPGDHRPRPASAPPCSHSTRRSPTPRTARRSGSRWPGTRASPSRSPNTWPCSTPPAWWPTRPWPCADAGQPHTVEGGHGQVAGPEAGGRGDPLLPAVPRLVRLRQRSALRPAPPRHRRLRDRRRHRRDHEGDHRPRQPSAASSPPTSSAPGSGREGVRR